MAVYKKTYRPYEGIFTQEWARAFVITRYELETLLGTRFMIALFAASAFWPLISAIVIYLNHSVDTLPLVAVRPKNLTPVNEQFFFLLMNVQAFWTFLATAYAGPKLIAPDLVDNALLLYLSRPLSRLEYVVGKMSVLLILLSFIQLAPPLALWGMQAKMAGGFWWRENLWLAWAIVAGAWVWMVFLALFALTISALVRWRIVAAAVQFGAFLVAAGFSEAYNHVMQTQSGYLINAGHVVGTIWMQLFRASTRDTIWKKLFSVTGTDLELWEAWMALAAFCAVFVWILAKRLRGREVVS